MNAVGIRRMFLAVVIGLAMLVVSLGLLGTSPAPALAQGLEATESVSLAPPQQAQTSDGAIVVLPVYTDPEFYNGQITDLSGNVIGEGAHRGEVRCDGTNCSQATYLQFSIPVTWTSEYEYRFKASQSVDRVERRAVVAGEGTLSSQGGTERFSVTATFQDNQDGTLWVRYEASRPDASFIIPRAPGRLEFR